MTDDFKKRINNMTELIESCWDSNQELDENGKPKDGLTFDERLNMKLNELDEVDKMIVQDAMNF